MSGYFSSATSGKKQTKQDYVGLSNQGATCYMNSLLQTLYMTPDFRIEIYKWFYEPDKHGDPSDSIPMQLQLLFSKLQIADSEYVETTGLTKSFQWDLRESFQQHDVQEFCRVLFDAIEQSMEGTSQSNVINELYQGTYIDYVKCLKCNQESCREDKFLDISLAVRNDFEKIYNKSVEMALENFIKHEELTGDNQYFCETCKGKNDAIKGLKFKSLPKILVLQLKRFDLDMTTMQRMKLNDKVTFPEILNMNPYISKSDVDNIKERNLLSIDRTKEFSDGENSYLIQSADKRPIYLENKFRKKISGDNSYFLRSQKESTIQKYLKGGRNVYELFSVLIHSGSALGGHYYAYIKSFENFKWYCFNDSMVTEISHEEIPKVFGGSTYSSGYYTTCSSNAYLLVYRRVEPDNLMKIEKTTVPAYIIEMMETEKNKKTQELLEKEEKNKMMKLKTVYKGVDKHVEIKKDSKISEFLEKAVAAFELQDVDKRNIRLRGYSTYYDTFQETFEDEKTIDQSGIYGHKVLAVEVKNPDEEFLPYDPTKLVLKAHLWKDDLGTYTRLTSSPKYVIIEKRETIRKLMSVVQETFSIKIEKQLIVRKSFNGLPEIITTSSYFGQCLSYAKIYEGSVLFIEENSGGPSKWMALLEEEQGKITIKFNSPGEKEPLHISEIFKNSISIDSQRTVLELKTEISLFLNINIDEFIMKKSNTYGGELKDLSQKLVQATLFNNSNVYIEMGRPSKPDEIRVCFQIALPSRCRDSDGSVYSIDSLLEMPVNINSKISQIKDSLCEELQSRFPTMEVSSANMRFRYNSHTVMGKILNNKEILKDLKASDRVSVCVQLLQSPEKPLESNDIIVYVKIWYPATWELSGAYEFVINKNLKNHDLGAKISEITGLEVRLI